MQIDRRRRFLFRTAALFHVTAFAFYVSIFFSFGSIEFVAIDQGSLTTQVHKLFKEVDSFFVSPLKARPHHHLTNTIAPIFCVTEEQ